MDKISNYLIAIFLAGGGGRRPTIYKWVLCTTNLPNLPQKIKKYADHNISLHDPQNTYLQIRRTLAKPSVSNILNAGIIYTHSTLIFMKPKFQYP